MDIGIEDFLIRKHKEHEIIEGQTEDFHLTIDNTGEDIIIYIDKFSEYEQQHFVYEITDDGLKMIYLLHETDEYSFEPDDVELIHENLIYYEPEIEKMIFNSGLI